MIRYHARWVLPVGAPPLRDGTVAVNDDRIAFVGSRTDAPPGGDVELGDAVLLPGLVNAHIHLDLAMFGGALHGLEFFPWMRALVGALSEATDEESLADASRWSVADQLAHGVTTMAHTGPGLAAFDALRAMGARGVAYIEAFGPDPAQCGASVADLRKRVDRARRDETALVRVGVSPHAPYSVSDALYTAIAEYAVADSLPVAVHIAESGAESDLVIRGIGEFADFLRGRSISVAPRAASPVALLDRTGVLATRPLCIHAIRVDMSDVARLAAAGATVAHCPRANAWFAEARAPLREYRDRGIAVGLGTDSLANNPEVRLLAEARHAADDVLTSAQRIEMATLGGARALRLGDVIGTLERGKLADIVAFACDDTRACDDDPARYLVERCATRPAALTVVAGAIRARDGRATGADGALDSRMAVARARIQGWRAARTRF